MDYSKCSTTTRGSRVVVQENKSRFEVLNPKRLTILKVEVDGCLISDDKEKCDWIISIEEPVKRAMYIELKGSDVDKAISQLKSTLRYTTKKYCNHKKECFAVTTRVPKHGPSIRRKCLDFYKVTNVTLSIKNKNSSVTA